MIDILFSFSLSLFGLFLILKTDLKYIAVDRPNQRSLHTSAVPRIGGLAIMFGTLVTWLFIGVAWEWILLPLLLIGISLVDDIRGLKARWRFLAQILVCAVFLVIHPQGIALVYMPLVLLGMVWVVNLYNFMDGSDGLAGGMALFGFGAYAVAAYLVGQTELAILCASLASSCLAFLIFNFHPARIFMGDSGSIPLGFLASALGVWGWQYNVWAFWFPLVVFSPFIVDASITLFKRLLKREKVWLPHKSHYYQRLVQMGWGHKKTAMVEYGLMVATSFGAIVFLHFLPTWSTIALLFWSLIYGILLCCVDLAWRRYKTLNPH